jgi:multidrug efflux pump subunit AcrA (membrane-fusion protein)
MVFVDTLFIAEKSAALKPPADAQVLSVIKPEGSRVARGEVIVQLDDRQQRAKVALAQTASASTAEINVSAVKSREAQARFASTERAARNGAAAEWELRQARAAADQAAQESRMARDRQAVEQRRLGVESAVLDSFRIRAPFDGRVTRLSARPGSTVRQSDTLAVVTDMRSLRGEAFVRARFYNLLKVGQRYPVIFSGGFARKATATLSYIDPVMTAGSFRIVFLLDNKEERTPSGLEGRVLLQSAAR